MASPARSALLLLAVALCSSLAAAARKSADGFFYGRATFYDDNQQGSCRYGTNIPEAYAAWPDGQEGFSQSCGTCWEVSCVNNDFTDAHGEQLSRSHACFDESKAIVVKIVDSCPCVHQNFASNQRWCCADAAHIDLGRGVFKQLAEERCGVIGAKWRQVSCDQLGQTTSTTSPTSSKDSGKDDGKDKQQQGDTTKDTHHHQDSGSSNKEQSGSEWQPQGWPLHKEAQQLALPPQQPQQAVVVHAPAQQGDGARWGPVRGAIVGALKTLGNRWGV